MISGIFGLNPYDSPVKPQFLDGPVPGVSLRISWRNIEPKIDRRTVVPILIGLDALHDKGKTATLLIGGGLWSPPWLRDYRDPENPVYATPYQESSRDGVLPIPYSLPYINRFRAMVEEIGPLIRDHPALKAVHMCGPCKAGEMHLVKNHQEVRPPVIPYDQATLVSAWQMVIDSYVRAFEGTELILNIAIPYRDDGLLEAVLDHARPHRVTLQNNSLQEKSNPDWKPHRLIREWPHNRGYQFVGGLKRMGSIETAVAMAKYQGARYLEALVGTIEATWGLLKGFPDQEGLG